MFLSYGRLLTQHVVRIIKDQSLSPAPLSVTPWWRSANRAPGDVMLSFHLDGTLHTYIPSHPSTGYIACQKVNQLATLSFTKSPSQLTGHDLLWCAIPLLLKQPFYMSTNGVFVVLHEKRGPGDACASPWMLMRSAALCLFHSVCLVKRCQLEWRGGTDARPRRYARRKPCGIGPR